MAKTPRRKSDIFVAIAVVLAVAGGIIAVVVTDFTGRSGNKLARPFVYDAPTRQIDPALRKYAEVKPAVRTDMTSPRGIAVGADRTLYVAGDRIVRLFDAKGDPSRSLAMPGEPKCLAVADDGTVAVGFDERVEVYDSQGERKAEWPPLGKNARIVSITVAGKDVFVADFGQRAVVRYDRSGKQLNTIGRPDPQRQIPGLLALSAHLDVAVSPDGLLWVASPGRRRLEAYRFDGNPEHAWGQGSATDVAGFPGCCNPTDITILHDGRFVTSEKGPYPLVKVYDAQGVLEAIVAAEDLPRIDGTTFDVAVDGDGRVYVLDPVARKVRIFERKRNQEP